MAYDYKNPTPPQRGDGRYNGKFPDTYEVIDCIREHYYDIFKSDLSLNGNRFKSMYQCQELCLRTYTHTSRKFGVTFDKFLKQIFTIYLENGTLNNPDNFIDFELHKKIFEENDEKEILEFIKRCILDITSRTVNMAISDNYVINFIHYPYERESSYATYTFWTNDEPIKTNKEIMQFIDQYSANRGGNHSTCYLSMISDDILKTMTPEEMIFINENLKALYGWTSEKNIEVDKKLEFVKIKNNT